MEGLALIDFDNFRSRRRRTATDIADRAQRVLNAVSRAFLSVFPETTELDARFYGGWIDVGGSLTQDAIRLQNILASCRGRRHGLIVRPTLATTIIQVPDFPLRGTVRGQGNQLYQKMVDTMIGCDAIHVAHHGGINIGIVTTDDDLLPAALSAHTERHGMLVWIRSRPVGSACNDTELRSRGLYLCELTT